MRIHIIVLIAALTLCLDLSAFDGDAWLVAGDRVRVRAEPSANAAVVAEVNAGAVVMVLKKTEVRDRFLPGDNFGFYWYYAEIPGKKKGWIYGKFLYQMNGERFSLNEELFRKSFVINGKKYDFGIAIEEAYPPMDDNGLTGSVIHAMPFFLEDAKHAAHLFKAESVNTFQDGDLKLPYFFRLYDSEGGMQKIKKIGIDSKGKSAVITMIVEFTTQTGGGEFSIMAKPSKGHMVITGYTMDREFEF